MADLEREKFDKLEQVYKEFLATYGDIKPGDPRAMALWDLSDEVDARRFQDGIIRNDEELSMASIVFSIVRAEQVRNRIAARSTEIPGYAIAMNDAARHLDGIANAEHEAYGNSPTVVQDPREKTASYINFFVRSMMSGRNPYIRS